MSYRVRRSIVPFTAAAAVVLGLAAAPATADTNSGGPTRHAATGSLDGHCARQDAVGVPGAELQVTSCLDDLTTQGLLAYDAAHGTTHTDFADWNGLHTPGTVNPSGVPGIQVDGYFPDTSHFNTLHGWNHDAQFVIRLPDDWNGGLVVTGAPGVRKQYSLDFLISDWVLAQGYAFASTDKGNNGVSFYSDGDQPGDAIVEWNDRVTQLTRAAKRVVKERYGHFPRRTYMTGISNGGYLTRWQLENHPELYDGGVDWEGTLFSDRSNLFTYLPTAVRYQLGMASADDMYAAGFARGSEPLWPYHEFVYWGLTQKTYRAEFDPGYDPTCPGPQLGGSITDILAPCPSDASYDWASRPAAVHAALRRVALTGKIQRPMLTLQGTLDALLPISTDSDVYAGMVAAAHRERLLRYYRIVGGNHVDSLVGLDPMHLRPILPCYRVAFGDLVGWVEQHVEPPASRTVARPDGPATDLVNSCSLD